MSVWRQDDALRLLQSLARLIVAHLGTCFIFAPVKKPKFLAPAGDTIAIIVVTRGTYVTSVLCR
jgi:hypothetical protein